MRIALLTDGVYPLVLGGMQRHSAYLARYLAEGGVEVDLYHPLVEGRDPMEIFAPELTSHIRTFEVQFPRGPSHPGHYLLDSWRYSARVLDVLRRNLDVDFVYAKGFTGWKLLAEKRGGMQVPPVGVNFHGYEMFQRAASARERLQQWMLRPPVRSITSAADFVFSYGRGISRILEGLGIRGERIIEVPAGIDPEWLQEAPAALGTPRRFLYLGRYERRKGVEELGAVLREMRPTPPFEFHFVGPIPTKLQIAAPHVRYHGAVTDSGRLQSLLRRADVLVCPSYSEGMPNAILEAMASGLAVIATDVGAVGDLVSEENGWLIEPANREALTGAIQGALRLPPHELDRKKRASLFLIRESHSWEAIGLRTIEAIRSAAAADRARALAQ